MVPRIYKLGGALPRDIRTFADMAACPAAYRPEDARDVKEMVHVLVEAERCALRVYTDIRNRTAGKEHRTCELALAIPYEQVEHEA